MRSNRTNKTENTTKSTPKRDVTTKKVDVRKSFHLDFLNAPQKAAWEAYQKNDLIFLLGPAGTGKTHLATGFAIHDILKNDKERLVITRPVVEAGENLGFLPGDFNEKITPYMMPIYDCIDKVCGGKGSRDREVVQQSLEISPLAYMRGRTFTDAIFILDEAQNCTYKQLKLALTRIGTGTKMIVTGDPAQSDLPGQVALEDIINRIDGVEGVGIIRFSESSVVRHPLVARLVKRLG